MEVQTYNVIYSTMTLAAGSLIALVGIFVIFRIQLQRERIKMAYEDIHKLLNLRHEFTTWHELRIAIDKKLNDAKEPGDDKHKSALKYKVIQVEKEINKLNYTIHWGIFVLMLVGVLFLAYVFILHFQNEIDIIKEHRFPFCIGLFIYDMVVSLFLLKYLIVCIWPRGDEYLW